MASLASRLRQHSLSRRRVCWWLRASADVLCGSSSFGLIIDKHWNRPRWLRSALSRRRPPVRLGRFGLRLWRYRSLFRRGSCGSGLGCRRFKQSPVRTELRLDVRHNRGHGDRPGRSRRRSARESAARPPPPRRRPRRSAPSSPGRQTPSGPIAKARHTFAAAGSGPSGPASARRS